MDWDKRLSHDLERKLREKLERGLGTGSYHGSQRGVPVSESVAGRVQEKEDFDGRAFEYHPPIYGPKGLLPEGEKQRVRELGGKPGGGKENEKIEAWMSAANEPTRAEVPDSQTWNGNVGMPIQIEDDDDEGDGEVVRSQAGQKEDVMQDGQTQAKGDTINHFDDLMRDIDNITDGNHDIDNDPVNSNNVLDYDEFDEAFDYPFSTDAAFGNTPITDQNDPNQQISFDHTAAPDSFEPGTQEVGETQMAEKARGEFEEFVHVPKSSGSEGQAGLLSANKDLPKLNLGSSILGKRKGSPEQSDQVAKKSPSAGFGADPTSVEALDGFIESPYLLGSRVNADDGNMPRDMLERYQWPDNPLLGKSQMTEEMVEGSTGDAKIGDMA